MQAHSQQRGLVRCAEQKLKIRASGGLKYQGTSRQRSSDQVIMHARLASVACCPQGEKCVCFEGIVLVTHAQNIHLLARKAWNST